MFIPYQIREGETQRFSISQSTKLQNVINYLQLNTLSCDSMSTNSKELEIQFLSLKSALHRRPLDVKKILNSITTLRHSSQNLEFLEKLNILKQLLSEIELTTLDLEDVIDDIHEYAYSENSKAALYKKLKMQELYKLLCERSYGFTRATQREGDDEVNPFIEGLLIDKGFCRSLWGNSKAKMLVARCQECLAPYRRVRVMPASHFYTAQLTAIGDGNL
jgi:hypothetical protein